MFRKLAGLVLFFLMSVVFRTLSLCACCRQGNLLVRFDERLTNLVEAQTADDPTGERAGNELSGEMLECASYFLVASWCIDGADPKAEKDMKDASSAMGGMAVEFGREFGVTDEAVKARMKLFIENMGQSMNKNCVNLSVLIDRYLKFCQGMQQNPTKRLQELLSGNICNSTYKCN